MSLHASERGEAEGSKLSLNVTKVVLPERQVVQKISGADPVFDIDTLDLAGKRVFHAQTAGADLVESASQVFQDGESKASHDGGTNPMILESNSRTEGRGQGTPRGSITSICRSTHAGWRLRVETHFRPADAPQRKFKHLLSI